MKYREIGEYLVVDPRVCSGRLTFKNTRLPVGTVLHWMAKGQTIRQILKAWPYLSPEAVAEAVDLSAKALTQVTGAAPLDGSLEKPAPWDEAISPQSTKRRLAFARAAG